MEDSLPLPEVPRTRSGKQGEVPVKVVLQKCWVEVQGSRADQHPRVYTRIEVLYRVRGQNVDPQAVARAIELSATRYCPVIAMLGKVAQVRTRYAIEEESADTP